MQQDQTGREQDFAFIRKANTVYSKESQSSFC
jgi:hypothetical protein